MLNRSIPPTVYPISDIALPNPDLVHLDNGIPVYLLPMGESEILKLEVVFWAGRPQEIKKVSSKATAQLIREGNASYTGAAIAEIMDFYGGTFSVPSNLDTSNFVLCSLKQHFQNLLPVFAESLLAPVFAEEEIQSFKDTNLQSLLVDLQKSDTIAYRSLTESIFGSEHPYGYNSTAEDYNAISRHDLILHYNEWYSPANCFMVLSGKVDDGDFALLNDALGSWKKKGQKAMYVPKSPDLTPTKEMLAREGAHQTAIKIGRKMFAKDHPDHNGMQILNTILGGYFGSRLMMNIRETSGYTYNIYSTVDTNIHDGIFYIASEVNPGYDEQVLNAIYHEIERLQRRSVSKKEMDMVRNYLLGTLMTAMDGPILVSEIVKSYISEGFPLSDINVLVKDINEITPTELRDLARKWLNPADFFEVRVRG